MILTRAHVNPVLGKNKYLDHWLEALNQILPDYDIDTPRRVAAFLAQTSHESGKYTTISENLNYRAESLLKQWPRYFPTIEIAKAYERQPERIANRAYANRIGNGPEESGDGWRYCGKGLIQLTGKANYEGYAQSLQISMEEAAEHLTTFEGCVQSACWFWENRNLNRFADVEDILGMTKVINGGTIGLEERKHYYQIFLNALEQ